MDLNHYFTNQEVEEVLQGWREQYPGLVQLDELGQSYENRPIWIVTLTNQATGLAEEKPALWIDANIHATEITGTTVALSVAYALLSGYGQDERITRLLDTGTFYIVPRLNPDGAHLALAEKPRYIRSGVRPFPWAEKDEGLHQQDLDGDGRILQMRLEDPNGDWKISMLDPRLLEKRQPDDFGGTYYRLLPEGGIEDYDGYIIKPGRPLEGLDFNRNFPFDWKTHAEQRGAGSYPASEKEIQAVVGFITSHPNINIALTYHTFSGVILRPYSTKSDDEIETNDLWVYRKLGEVGTALTAYRNVSTYHDFRYHPKETTTGAFDDWMYDQHGVYAFTIELWDLPTRAGIADRKFMEWFRQHAHEDDLKILQWVDENVGPEGYVDWYPFDHPQLGRVELGGWDSMYTWRNPPLEFLGEETARNLPFVLALAGMLPHLQIYAHEKTPLGDETYRISLVVENSGFLPTYTSEQGKKRQSARPVRAELELPEGAEILNGKRRVELGHLEGRSNKLDVTTLWSISPTDNRARVEWVVKVPAGTVSQIKVKVLSERAGVVRA